MVNPDGVDLVLNGLQRDNPYYNQLLQWNKTGRPFSLVWQANIRGDVYKRQDVKEIQSLLMNLGYYFGSIDGIYGPMTANAVRGFQRSFGLVADGIVGPITFRAMEPYLRGYAIYTIKPGDTLYAISRSFGTSVNLSLIHI